MIVLISILVILLAVFRITDPECSKKEEMIMRKAILFAVCMVVVVFVFPRDEEKNSHFEAKESNFQTKGSFSEGMVDLEIHLDKIGANRVIVLPEMVILGERQEGAAYEKEEEISKGE